MPRSVRAHRRARWAVALLGVSAVLGFGAFFVGAAHYDRGIIGNVWVGLTVAAGVAGLVQLWRAAALLAIAPKAVAALTTVGVGLVLLWALAPSVGSGGVAPGLIALLAAAIAGVALWPPAPAEAHTVAPRPVELAALSGGPRLFTSSSVALVIGLLVAVLLASALLGSSALLTVAAVALPLGLAGVAVVTLRRRQGREARPRASVIRAIVASLIGLLAVIAVGALDLLVWTPLAQAPGFTVAEIFAALSPADRSIGLSAIWWWIGFWTLMTIAAAVVAGLGARLLTVRTVVGWALVLTVGTTLCSFFAGFSLGMSIADTLPPFSGRGPAAGGAYLLFGQLALCALILGTIPPPRVRRDAVPLAA